MSFSKVELLELCLCGSRVSSSEAELVLVSIPARESNNGVMVRIECRKKNLLKTRGLVKMLAI